MSSFLTTIQELEERLEKYNKKIIPADMADDANMWVGFQGHLSQLLAMARWAVENGYPQTNIDEVHQSC